MFGIGFQHDGGHDVTIVRVVVQRIVHRVLSLLGVGGNRHKLFWPTVDLTPLEVHDALAKGLVGSVLVGGSQCGADIKPARISFIAVLGIHELANHFGNIFRVHLVVAGSRLDFELLILGKLGFLLGDESVFHHPVDDVALAQPRALRVADGVVGGGCFGQTCQHGRLRNRDVFQRLAIVGFGRGRKAVRAIAQENLVHVNFENLVLA